MRLFWEVGAIDEGNGAEEEGENGMEEGAAKERGRATGRALWGREAAGEGEAAAWGGRGEKGSEEEGAPEEGDSSPRDRCGWPMGENSDVDVEEVNISFSFLLLCPCGGKKREIGRSTP